MSDLNLETITDEAIEIGFEEAFRTTREEIAPTVQEIKQAAIAYKTLILEYKKEVEYFEFQLKRQKQIRNSFTSEAKKNKEYLSEEEYIASQKETNQFLASGIPDKIYQASFAFQKQLNLFIGQEMRMVFVVQGTEGPELYEMRFEDIIPGYSSKSKLAAKYSGDLLTMTHINLDSIDQGFVNRVKATYAEIQFRWRVAKKIPTNRIMWQIPMQKWHAMKVASFGDINEAYATIIIKNSPPPNFDGDMESNVRDFMEYVRNVDNESGLLAGDVSHQIDDKTSLEFGIKSAGASALGLKQIYDLADKISQLNLDEIENAIRNQKEINHIRKRTRNRLVRVSKSHIDTMTKAIEKRKSLSKIREASNQNSNTGLSPLRSNSASQAKSFLTCSALSCNSLSQISQIDHLIE